MEANNQKAFGAQLLALPEIFKDRFLIIPDYQRGYAWDEKQVEEMLTDLEHLIKDDMDMRHYTGTLVLSRPANLPGNEYHVVDGQQRLTTLVILMRLLSEYLSDEEKADCQYLYVRRGELGSEQSVLSTNSDTKLFFDRVILGSASPANEPPSLEAHARLLQAKKLIKDWLKKIIKGDITSGVVKDAVEKEFGFLVYAPKEDAETGIMFEVINNRGKQLSELEKVKNYLIYCSVKLSATTLRDEINGDWSDILRNLNISKKTNTADEGAFLRYCTAVYFELGKSDSQYGYDQIKAKLDISSAVKSQEKRSAAIATIKSFVVFMKNSALWYARLYGQAHTGLSPALIAVLDKIRAQDRHASIMPLFLALVIKEDAVNDYVLRLLNLLEILNFRVYMAFGITQRTDSGQADLYWFASQYYYKKIYKLLDVEEVKSGKDAVKNDYQALEYRLVEFINYYSPDSVFADSFRLGEDSQFDYFSWGGIRYFLMSYEEFLQPNKTIQIDKIIKSRSEGKSSDYLSIEHVWARENRSLQGENDRKIDGFEKRRLGNFVLLELRLNIKGGNRGIDDKLPIYIDCIDGEPPSDLMQVKEMAKNAKSALRKYKDEMRTKNYYLSLYKDINDKQEKRYIAFAEKRWSISEYIGYDYLISQNEESEE